MNLKTLMALTVAAFASLPAQADQLQDSERMIARCLDYAASQKYPPLSVGVYDASAVTLAFRRQDGASAATAEAAQLKARTAIHVNASTADLAQVDAPTRDLLLVMQMTTLAGGVPLTDDKGRITGAVGVSGGTTEQDTECAQRAAEPAPAKKK